MDHAVLDEREVLIGLDARVAVGTGRIDQEATGRESLGACRGIGHRGIERIPGPHRRVREL